MRADTTGRGRLALALALAATLLVTGFAPAAGSSSGGPSSAGSSPDGAPGRPAHPPRPVAAYDFEHPVPGDRARERDRGRSGTTIELVNGGARSRVTDDERPGRVLRTRQISPATASSDDWKAGVYGPQRVPTLRAFNGARQTTVMGWFRMSGDNNPAPNSNTPDPDDRYQAIGLAGILSGTSQGHDVRALLELITVEGEMKVVALGRRLDGGSSQTFAADADWRRILPPDTWVSLAATFDFDTGTMALYRDGRALPGRHIVAGDPWEVAGPPEPDAASPTDPRGIKIGGSYPQNTQEGNPCDCRMDDLMFFDRALTPAEIMSQYRRTRG
ncbi:LamG-like jellyroll fold domain-containing protein [Streptomyces sp. NBC_01508]|uniref:LamG-like jellyroll fold domain-containing protein n=1 Tax=Streptomyces sp. NBC_01508 TaxID=2903888 RepID=UPI0038701E52